MKTPYIVGVSALGLVGAYFLFRKNGALSIGLGPNRTPVSGRTVATNTAYSKAGATYPFNVPQAPRADIGAGNNQPWYSGPVVAAAAGAAVTGIMGLASNWFSSDGSDGSEPEAFDLPEEEDVGSDNTSAFDESVSYDE